VYVLGLASGGDTIKSMAAKVEVFDDRVCVLGEGPHFDEQANRVTWIDILGARVLWRSLDERGRPGDEGGEVPVPAHVGAAVPRRNGGLVICLPDGPTLIDPDGTLRILGGYPGHRPGLRSNDAKADPAGRLWLGTMAYDERPGAGRLYRLDPGATVPAPVLEGVTVSNGLGWSPDGTTMYYIDSPTRQVDALAFDPATGALGERRVFAKIEDGAGFPDGLTVDADGGVWVALWGGAAVRHYLADGTLARVVDLPTPQVTSCAFAGADFGVLVITTAAKNQEHDPTAGLTYAYTPGDVVGRPVDRFAG
jgi:sugar lactone lactonase YvrE